MCYGDCGIWKTKSIETKHDTNSHFDKNWKCSMTWIQMGIQNTRCPSIFWKTSLDETLHDAYENAMSRSSYEFDQGL